VRRATIALFNGLPEASFLRMGKGTGTFNNATVRALAYHIAAMNCTILILSKNYIYPNDERS